MSVPDPIEELRTLLLNDADVSALAGERVFGGAIPQDKTSGMPQATVVLNPAGGPGRRGTSLYRNTRVDTLCYGSTLRESWQLHLAVREALENAIHPVPTVKEVQITSDGSNMVDPAEQWPLCIASYLVMSTVTS